MQAEEQRRVKAAQAEERRRCETLKQAADEATVAVEAGNVQEARRALNKLLDPEFEARHSCTCSCILLASRW